MSAVTADIGFYVTLGLVGIGSGLAAILLTTVVLAFVRHRRLPRLRWTPQALAKRDELEELLRSGIYSYSEASDEWAEWYGAGVFGEPITCPRWVYRFGDAAREGVQQKVWNEIALDGLLSEVNQKPGYGFDDSETWSEER